MANIKFTGLSTATPPIDNGSVIAVSVYDGVSTYTSEKLTFTQLKDEINLFERGTNGTDTKPNITGDLNTINSANSVIGGGVANNINASTSSGILSGKTNQIYSNSKYNAISGGEGNKIHYYAYHSAIVGGQNNNMNTYVYWSTIANGKGNTATSTDYSFMGSGKSNSLSSANYAFLGTGYNNTISGSFSSVLNGTGNNTNSLNNVHIIGTGITADEATCTFVNKLKAVAGDIETTGSTNGVILESPDGTRYRATMANGGTWSIAAA